LNASGLHFLRIRCCFLQT